jgi:predicted RND superfamily exporter protein
MWKNLGEWLLRNRLWLLLSLAVFTAVMGYYASKVQLSYDFAKAIPTDNPKYKDYLSFKEKFGEDGNLLTIGFIKKDIFSDPFFSNLLKFHQETKKIDGVEDVISVTTAITLLKNDSTEKLIPTNLPRKINSQRMSLTAWAGFS